MIVVADSSPLIALCRIGRLELLRDLFGIFIIPNAVRAEVSVSHAEKEGAKKALSADWIERQAVRDIPLVRLLRHDFGAGECQAILLAREVEAAHNANERTPWQDGSETLGPYPHGSGRDAD